MQGITAQNLDHIRTKPGFIRKIGAFIAARRASRQVAFELSVLTDRDLTDLSISRSEIPAIVDDSFRRAYHEALLNA